MEKIFIDTGGWVAFFVQNDKHHENAVSIFNELKNKKASLYTSDYVIDETISTILSRSNRKQSVIAGDALFTSKIITIVNVTPNYLLSSWDLYKKYKDKFFSFTDVTCFTIMKDLLIHKVFSFDEEFAQAGFIRLR